MSAGLDRENVFPGAEIALVAADVGSLLARCAKSKEGKSTSGTSRLALTVRENIRVTGSSLPPDAEV
jgi:hypothetical protein